MRFGDVLRELIEERGMTQKQLGRDLNLAPSTLGNYVNNLREPDYETLKRIAAYFQVSIDYLLDHHVWKAENHQEARLLRQYRSMEPSMQELFLAQGEFFLHYHTPRSKENP